MNADKQQSESDFVEQVIPKVDGVFASMSDIYAIAQINPIAAILVLRFHPDYYRETAFYEGQTMGEKIPTIQTVNALVGKTVSKEQYDALAKEVPAGMLSRTQWRFIKEENARNPVLKIESFYQDQRTDARLDPVYPTIELVLTPNEPYRVVRWSVK